MLKDDIVYIRASLSEILALTDYLLSSTEYIHSKIYTQEIENVQVQRTYVKRATITGYTILHAVNNLIQILKNIREEEVSTNAREITNTSGTSENQRNQTT